MNPANRRRSAFRTNSQAWYNLYLKRSQRRIQVVSMTTLLLRNLITLVGCAASRPHPSHQNLIQTYADESAIFGIHCSQSSAHIEFFRFKQTS